MKAGNWKKAREYYNKILDIYPENAHAWVGLWLATDGIQYKSLNALRNSIIGMTENPTKRELNIHKDFDEIDDDGLSGVDAETDTSDVFDDFYNDLQQYVVPNYYKLEDMEKNLPEKLPKYMSARKFLRELQSYSDSIFKNVNYKRALQFATEDYKRELQELKNDIESRWKSKFEEELARDREEEEKLRAGLIEEYKISVQKIQEEKKAAEAKRETDYGFACHMNSSQKAPFALAMFKQLGNYKDAQERKTAVEAVVAKQNEIGDGKRYLINTILNSDLNAVIDYKNAKQDTMFKEHPSIRNIIFSLVYVFFMVAPFIILEWPAMIGIVAGYAACYFLWKRDLILPGYIVLVIIQAVSIAFWDISVAAIVGAMYAASYCIKGGLAKKIMSNMQSTVNLKQAEKQIQNDERIIENELNEIWQRAFSIDYDGVHLSSALLNESMGYADTVLRANNIQTPGNNGRPVDVDRIVQDAMKGDWTHFNDIFK